MEARWGDESHWNRWKSAHAPKMVVADRLYAANRPRAKGGIRILARDPELASAGRVLA